MGTPITTPGSNRDNCPKISTSCVIWQGPDIPCINLCAGDSIDEVVFKLATLLCDVTENVLDVTTLEFSCFIQSGVEDPQTLLQLLQLIINKTCTLESIVGNGAVIPVDNSKVGDPYMPLPPCLYFTNDKGDLVVSLPVSEYVVYLASIICTIILDINSINSNISILTSNVNNLQVQVSDLQAYTYEIYVTSQCASAPTVGQTLLIQDAFANLEASYCNMLSSVGISTLLVSAVNRQCPSLASSLQLNNPLNVMSDLSGWVDAPTTVADTITNLWLTLCDLRFKVENYFSLPPVLPCVLAVPENVTVLTIGTAYSTVTWTAPSYAGLEIPFQYRIEVFEWTGTAPTGLSVYDNIYSGTTFTANISGVSIVIGTQYVVYVHAVYTCGESNGAPVVSDLLVPTVLFKVKFGETAEPDTTVYCTESSLPVAYDATNVKTKVELVNAITLLPVTNGYAYNIDVVIRYEVTSCSFYGSAYIDITIPILPGASFADYIYEAETFNNCGTALCTPVNTTISCGVSISDMYTVFNTGLPVCL